MCKVLVSYSCQHNVQQWIRCQIPLGEVGSPLPLTCHFCRGHAIVKAPCFDCGGPNVYIDRTHEVEHNAANSQLCAQEWRTVTPDEYFLNLIADEYTPPETAGKYIIWIPCEACADGRHQGPCLRCDFSSHDVERCLDCTPWFSIACEKVLEQTPGPPPFPAMLCDVDHGLACAPEEDWVAWMREKLERRMPNVLPAPETEEWPELPVPEFCDDIWESSVIYQRPRSCEACDEEDYHIDYMPRSRTVCHHGLMAVQTWRDRRPSLRWA